MPPRKGLSMRTHGHRTDESFEDVGVSDHRSEVDWELEYGRS
jgi:hypothetical protein